VDKIAPVAPADRNLNGPDVFLLWAGAAVSLAEIWAGGMLAPLGLAAGLAAIILGHVIGNTPLGLASLLGAREGLPSMVATRPSLGRRGSYLAAGLNIVQLVGWTGVMLWLAGQAAAALAQPFGPHSAAVWTVLAGAGTTLWALLGSRHWRWLHRVSITALILLCLQMSWLAWQKLGAQAPAGPAAGEGLGFGIGLDLVIAMPISWLPLAADYARFSRRPGGAVWGSWWGYFIISSWMYALGLAAALATGSSTPEAMILELMAAGGWLWAALAVVILSTFTTTFLDVYSTAVSSLNLPVNPGHNPAVLLAGGLGTLLALAFPAEAYEPFLLYIGSFFCPLFGVVLADYFWTRRRTFPEDLADSTHWRGFNVPGLAAWAVGFIIYRLALGWPTGASLPSLILAGLAYGLLARGSGPRRA